MSTGKRIPFKVKLIKIMAEQGKTWLGMRESCGVCRETVWKGIRRRPTLCAIAYFLEMRVEDLVEGTEMEDIWYS